MDIAKCQKQNKKKYGNFIEEYLFSRENISLIVLLLDIRHKPTENDKLMYDYIKSTKKPYILVANKADKIAVTKVSEEIEKIKNDLNMDTEETVLPFSSERRIYIEDIWNKINRWSEI